MDKIFIQHRFTIVEGDKSYTDAIVLPQEDYEKLKKGDIDTLKQERFDNWKVAIQTAQEAPVDPVKNLEDVKATILSLKEQLKTLESQEVELTATVDALPIEVDVQPIKGGK